MIFNLSKQKKYSDTEYIIEIANRNARITEIFYNDCKKYFNSTYTSLFSRNDIKEDIFQQSFVKLWTEIETGKIFLDNEDIFRYDKYGNLRCLRCSLKTFLLNIAKNDYHDWLRHENYELENDFDSFAYMMEVRSAVRPDESSESLQEQIIANCVFELPPRCKDILTMFYYDGKSLDEIMLARGEKNLSKNGLKTGKYKCMEMLKSRVKDMYKHHNLKY